MTTTMQPKTSTGRAICHRETLVALLATARTIGTARFKPILGCAKLTFADNAVTVQASNLEQTFIGRAAQVEIQEPFETAVDATDLYETLRRMGDDTVALSLDSDVLTVTNSNAKRTLYTLPPGDMPPAPEFAATATAKLPVAEFARLFRLVEFAIPKEATAYCHQGINVIIGKGRLTIQATNRRIATEAYFQTETTGNLSVIFPSAPLRSIIDSADDDIEIELSENAARLTCGDASIITNLIEGTFPPFEDLFPTESDTELTIGREELISAVNLCALSTNEENRGLRFALTKKGLSITSREPKRGESTYNIPAKVTGKDLEIGIASHYLSAVLSASEGDEAMMRFQGHNRAILFPSNKNCRIVQMPVNLQ